MIKCEVEYNIVEQCLNVYMFDHKYWFIYNPDAVDNILKKERTPHCFQEDIEFLKIPYEFCEELEAEIAKKYAGRKGVDVSLFENTSKDSHIEDLKWVLTHFINKDKRED